MQPLGLSCSGDTDGVLQHPRQRPWFAAPLLIHHGGSFQHKSQGKPGARISQNIPVDKHLGKLKLQCSLGTQVLVARYQVQEGIVAVFRGQLFEMFRLDPESGSGITTNNHLPRANVPNLTDIIRGRLQGGIADERIQD